MVWLKLGFDSDKHSVFPQLEEFKTANVFIGVLSSPATTCVFGGVRVFGKNGARTTADTCVYVNVMFQKIYSMCYSLSI